MHRPRGGPAPVSFQGMARLLLLTNALAPSAEVLPALGLLTHQVRIIPAEPTALVDAPPCDAVLLDAACCDPLYRKAIRVSVGAALTTPFAQLGADEDLAAGLATAGFDVVSISPRGSCELSELSCGPRVAALFGAEGAGLPPELLDRTRSVRIDMAANFDSLNVATTSGLVLYQLSKRRSFERRA